MANSLHFNFPLEVYCFIFTAIYQAYIIPNCHETSMEMVNVSCDGRITALGIVQYAFELVAYYTYTAFIIFVL